MRVLITGISGFLGSHLALEIMKKHSVFGIGRRKIDLPQDYEYIMSDLGKMSPNELLQINPDVIIHSAAKADLIGEFKEYYIQNFEITKKLIDLFPNCKFIYISTPSVYNNQLDQYDINEKTAINIQQIKKSNYAYTKYLAEIYLTKNHSNFTIIRPRAILGPNDNTIWPNLVNAKIFPIFKKGNVILSYTHVSDVAKFCAKLIEEKNDK